jgi:hypothetical protein
MKESTLAKITAAATAAKRTAQKALAANPNPEWTEHEMHSIDEWIAHQDVKIERSEAVRRLVELGLRAVERLGAVVSRPVLGGLHHQYCRI